MKSFKKYAAALILFGFIARILWQGLFWLREQDNLWWSIEPHLDVLGPGLFVMVLAVILSFGFLTRGQSKSGSKRSTAHKEMMEYEEPAI